jgi:hypothetical protein
MQIDFIRGHMGGNRIVLLCGEQLPEGRELELAVTMMGPNYLYAHEAGILYRTNKRGEIRAKIAEPTLPSFISACGGLTQVLGVALVETGLGSLLGIEKDDLANDIILLTESGPTPLKVEIKDGKAFIVKTDMSNFLEECYEHGFGVIKYDGLAVIRAGKFMVVNADRFKDRYPETDFVNWNSQTRTRLLAIQDYFLRETGEVEPNVVLYDQNPERDGEMRIVFPHYVKDDLIEPSCGTGTVAFGMALVESGELDRLSSKKGSRVVLKIESGGGIELGGPDLTTLEMEIEDGKAKSAAFSHSRVEVTVTGKVRLA